MIIVNPGTHAINGKEQEAVKNMKHFISDLDVKCDCVRISEKDYGDGRFAFLIWKDRYCHEIQMPGVDLSTVIGYEGQSIFERPRLYVDGSSWLWEFALNMADFGEDE